MTINPTISFSHILNELSVNRHDPCELVRELISNSYDAQADNIKIVPIPSDGGLIYFDDGPGVDQINEVNGITPYKAFFSIGTSTKRKGDGIGYKCQGTKLCFSGTHFLMITRCEGEDKWRVKVISSPLEVINSDYDLSPDESIEPWAILGRFFKDEPQPRAACSVFSEQFFKENFIKGTLIAVRGFVPTTKKYFDTVEIEKSYLFNYIKLYTAHGDVRRITRAQGFSASSVSSVGATLHQANLDLYEYGSSGGRSRYTPKRVDFGWWYLAKNDAAEATPKSPQTIYDINDGKFYARFAQRFEHGAGAVSLILAIDGWGRCRERYRSLGRRGDAGCGIKLSDQRGVIICSQGVRIASFGDYFDQAGLDNFRILTQGSTHYVLMIDGNFDLVTNRNQISQSSKDVLLSSEFVENVKTFLNNAYHSASDHTFKQLIQRLNRIDHDRRLEKYIEDTNAAKAEIRSRGKFGIPDSNGLPPLLIPENGEENLVGSHYGLLGTLVPSSSPFKQWWLTPLTFDSRGIDSIAAASGLDGRPNLSALLALEYKFHFDPTANFNHPLVVTDYVVCWEFDEVSTGSKIDDEYNWQGTKAGDIVVEGVVIGFEIRSLVNRADLSTDPKVIKVLSLKKLIEATYPGTTWVTPIN